LVACADLADSLQRLVCFDREIKPFRNPAAASTSPAPVAAPRVAAPVPAPAPAVPAPAAPPVVVAAPKAPASLGEEQLKGKSRPPAPSVEETAVHARITNLRSAAASFFVTLDNGQVWRHEDERLGGYLREGDAVTVTKGSLGSYRLTQDAGDSRNWIRATRVR
jgi:hypothetical protein